MEDITDEEFVIIMDYLNKHTSPRETREIEARRATDSSWEAKIKTVEEMRFKQRYAEARQALKPVFEQPLVAETRVVSLWKNTPAWLSAAAVVLMLGGAYWGYQYLQKEVTAGIQQSKDSTHQEKDKQRNLPSISLSEIVSDYIQQPFDIHTIPPALTPEAEGINEASTRKKTIRSLEKRVRYAPAPISSLPDDISYGSGSDTLPPVFVDSLGRLGKEKAGRQLLLSVGHLKNQDAEKALKMLAHIHEPSLSQEVNWYKALAYLQLGAAQKARTELLTLFQGPHKTEAQKLLILLP